MDPQASSSQQNGTESDFQNMRSTIIGRRSEAGTIMRSIGTDWMEFRRNIFLASITLLILVTPFSKEYVSCFFIFSFGYILLFLSSVLGLCAEETRLKNSHKMWNEGINNLDNVIKIFEKSNEESASNAQKELKKDVSKPIRDSLELAAKWSGYAFWVYILSLTLIVISILPKVLPW